MARIERDQSFPTGGANVADVVARLRDEHGFKGEDPPADGELCELRGGSQWRMRLLGGWFVDAKALPKRATVGRSGDGIHIRLEDTVGVGVVDPKFRKKYEQEFDAILVSVQAGLAGR